MTARALRPKAAAAAATAASAPGGRLTPAERRIMQLIGEGKSSKEIGADLSIHYRTVENHRSNICRKLGIDNKIPVAPPHGLPQTGSPMASTFFDPGDQRAAKVHDLFSRIAPRYDLINDLQSFGLHRYWKRRVLRLARPHAGQRALDLCCGTGDLALALARRGAHVAGLDFSEPMLDVAERRKCESRIRS